MLFIELADLQALTQDLSGVMSQHSGAVLYGRMECYATRGAGSDRKLYKDIEEQLVAEIAKSPQSPELHGTPMGLLTEKHSRDTFKYLIATLNASFPDYDFRHVDPAVAFRREVDFGQLMANLDAFLRGQLGSTYDVERGPVGMTLRERIYAAIHKEIAPAECEMYSYIPDSDAFTEESIGSVDSITIFFFNKKKKRVLFFSARAMSASALDNVQAHPGYDESEFSSSHFGVGGGFAGATAVPSWLASTQPSVQGYAGGHMAGYGGGWNAHPGQHLGGGYPYETSFANMHDVQYVSDDVADGAIFGLEADGHVDLRDPTTWDKMAYSQG